MLEAISRLQQPKSVNQSKASFQHAVCRRKKFALQCQVKNGLFLVYFTTCTCRKVLCTQLTTFMLTRSRYVKAKLFSPLYQKMCLICLLDTFPNRLRCKTRPGYQIGSSFSPRNLGQPLNGAQLSLGPDPRHEPAKKTWAINSCQFQDSKSQTLIGNLFHTKRTKQIWLRHVGNELPASPTFLMGLHK